MSDKYIILTSAMGLGTYVPALQLRDYLIENGALCGVELYENYFADEMKASYLKNKDAYHKNMKVAIAGHKIAAKRLKSALSEECIDEILQKWNEEGIHKFIIISGSWIEIVKKYRKIVKKDLEAYIVHMDIGVAPSWKNFEDEDHLFTEIFPFDQDGIHFILENHFQQISKDEQRERGTKLHVFTHGGGWGMGNYQSVVNELVQEENISVISAAYNENETNDEGDYCIVDSNWQPWMTDPSGQYQYPKMKTKRKNEEAQNIQNQYSNGLYKIYRDCDAIISKPGGATLMDSLIVGVPIVFLEPIAEHERVNAEVWKSLGLGVSYEDWKNQGFSRELLLELKNNLLDVVKEKTGVGRYILEG